LVAGFLLAGLVAAIAAPVWDAKDGVIISPDKAKRFLDQCSRPSPQNVIGFWLPTPAQIAELEVRLPGILEAALKGQRHSPVKNYWRQYAGLVTDKHRTIYVNGFRRNPDQAAEKLQRDQLRTGPVIVCDGGNGAFGVEYDPRTHGFEGLAFNGSV
jgi:hypothetical protein